MAITAKQVNELRKITGAGMMDCKNALIEADGDLEQAIDILRKKGQKIAAKRADREASEGQVYAWTSADNSEGIALALNCETEPVSNIDEFKELGTKILEAAVANKPADQDSLNNLEIDGKKVSEQILELTGKVGEKIEISGYAYLKGDAVVSYTHGSSIVVLVELSKSADDAVIEAGKNAAMQIAAMNPVAVDENGVDSTILAREKQIGVDKAREEGKPEHILEKIAEGYVKKFLQDNTLLSQAYVKDSKVTVGKYLNNVSGGLTVTRFERVGIGR